MEEQLQEVKKKLEEAMETVEDQEFALEVGDEEITRLKDVKRKHNALLEAKVDAKRVAVQKAKDTEKEKWERKLKAEQELKEKELKNHQKEVEMQYKDTFEAQRKSVNVAHAEKRAAWTRTAQANRKVKRLTKELDQTEMNEETDQETEEDDAEAIEDGPVRRLPFEVLPRRDEAGRFQSEAWQLRVLRWAQEARGVAPSTVSHNIQDVLDLVAPGNEIPATSYSTNTIIRSEVTLAGEVMAAWKFADCKRVMTAGWDESTKERCLLLQLPGRAQGRQHRGHLLTRPLHHAGGRNLAGSPGAHRGPHPRLLAQPPLELHGALREEAWGRQLGARRRALAREHRAASAVRGHRAYDGHLQRRTMHEEDARRRYHAHHPGEEVGAEAWEAMSVEERNRKYKLYRGDCWQHLRNIIIDAMAATGDAVVKEKLRDDLAEFSSFERIDPEGGCVIIGAFNQFHHGR